MIRISASVVLRVLDGFTGQSPAPSAIRFTLDGEVCRPISKTNGYYVLTNLSDGEHELVLRGANYADERLLVNVDGQYRELMVTMKPGCRYPFGRAVTWLTLQCEPGQQIWMAAKNAMAELRIAQDAIKAGEDTGRLFFPASVQTMALPRDLLVVDGARTEICRLEELDEPLFAQPMAFDHKRSVCLYPVQSYTANEAGEIRAVFREPTAVELFAAGWKKPVTLELTVGDNVHQLKT